MTEIINNDNENSEDLFLLFKGIYNKSKRAIIIMNDCKVRLARGGGQKQ